MAWINLIAPKAMDIAKNMVLSPDAKALLSSNPSATAGEFTKAMADQNLNTDAVAYLSRGMKPQAGVQWASESAAKVAPKLPPSEVKAAQLAKAWTQGQTSPRALQAALAQNPPAGPGTWAAQAASFASQAPAMPAVAAPSLAAPSMSALGAPALAGAAPALPAVAAPTQLTSTAIAGAVHLSAAVDTGALQMMTPALDGMPAMPLASPLVAPPPPDMPALTLPSQLTPPQLAAMNDSLKPFVDLGMQIAQGMPTTPAMPGMPALPVV